MPIALQNIFESEKQYTWKQIYDQAEIRSKEHPSAEAVVQSLIPLIKTGAVGAVEDFSGRLQHWFVTGRHNGTPTHVQVDPDVPNQEEAGNVRLEELLCMAFFNRGKLPVPENQLTVVDYQVPTFNSKENIDLVGWMPSDRGWRLLLIEAKAPGSEESALRALLEITAHVDKLLCAGVMSDFIREAKALARIDEDPIEIQPVILLFQDEAYCQPNARSRSGTCASQQAVEIARAISNAENDYRTSLVVALNERLRRDASKLEGSPSIAPLGVLLETAAQRKHAFRRIKKPALAKALLRGIDGPERKPELDWNPEFAMLTLG